MIDLVLLQRAFCEDGPLPEDQIGYAADLDVTATEPAPSLSDWAIGVFCGFIGL